MVQYAAFTQTGRAWASALAGPTQCGARFLPGPGLKDIDPGLLRNITLERGMAFQIRAEVTNVLNRVSLSNPTSTLSSGNDGKITGAPGTQRVIQLGLADLLARLLH